MSYLYESVGTFIIISLSNLPLRLSPGSKESGWLVVAIKNTLLGKLSTHPINYVTTLLSIYLLALSLSPAITSISSINMTEGLNS